MNVIMIDNFDSFTYNIVEEFRKLSCDVTVFRNDIGMDVIREKIATSDLLVISPGPSSPKQAGISVDLIRMFAGELPIFGICLGHQCIIEAFGGVVSGAGEIIHGQASAIHHDGAGVFRNLPMPLRAARYHSLAGSEIPAGLTVSAKAGDIVMGVRHAEHLIEGVQFHPESILTPHGSLMIENLLEMVKHARIAQ